MMRIGHYRGWEPRRCEHNAENQRYEKEKRTEGKEKQSQEKEAAPP